MEPIFAHSLTGAAGLEVHAEKAEPEVFQGRAGLRLINGLVLLPSFSGQDLTIRVSIAAPDACYPGLAFRARDVDDFELAYAQPHTSGGWDAIQYDPIFHGANTWQAYHGPCWQGAAHVPTGQWFELRVDAYQGRAAISVDGQPPLVIERLAHATREGRVGLWTYLPATFSDLRISACNGFPDSGETPALPENCVTDWDLAGVGPVAVEPGGILNLNRYLPMSQKTANLTHRFSLPAARRVRFGVGFSDVLTLSVDRQVLFQGENHYQGMQSGTASRGYILPGQHQVEMDLPPGEHVLSAEVAVDEPFGWGLALQMLPVESPQAG